MSRGEVLSSGAIFEIRSTAGLVFCRVMNREDVSAEEGARCAADMHATLTQRVLVPTAPYRGLVMDVREGPPAFGPKTRASLEKIFAAARESGRRLAVLVGTSATQRMQFGNLSLECAPDHSRVFSDEPSVEAWFEPGH